MTQINSFEKWFWTKCDTLSSDTSFAHSLSKEAWNYQQKKINSLHLNIESLHAEIDRLQEQYSLQFECVQGRQKTIIEQKQKIDELESKLSQLQPVTCWSCNKVMLDQQLKHNDGFCIYCVAEIEDIQND